jgi:hypothetical protein
MPLIRCTACGREISTEAAACPQCGHPNQPASLAPTPCKSCSQPAIGACKTCGGFYCDKHGRVTSYGPLCSACYVCKSCSQLPIGACKRCGGFYCAKCAKHGGVRSSGPLCSACYVCKSCGQLPIGACEMCGGFYCTSHGGERLFGALNLKGVTVAKTRRLCDACTPDQYWMRFVLMRQWVAIILIWIILLGGVFIAFFLASRR